MILTCPACETQYFAEDSTIGSEGRSVKCAACSHAWFVRGDGKEEAGPDTAPGAHERYLEMVRIRRKRRSRTTAIAVWLIAGACLLATAGGAFLYRNDIVQTWPQTASAYRAIGLDVNRFGLDFENIERARELRGTMPVLMVAANVRNVSRRTRKAPVVRVGLLDDYGREIAFMLAEIIPAEIGPGEAGQFKAVLENPPVDSYSLSLRFVTAEEAAQASGAGAS